MDSCLAIELMQIIYNFMSDDELLNTFGSTCKELRKIFLEKRSFAGSTKISYEDISIMESLHKQGANFSNFTIEVGNKKLLGLNKIIDTHVDTKKILKISIKKMCVFGNISNNQMTQLLVFEPAILDISRAVGPTLQMACSMSHYNNLLCVRMYDMEISLTDITLILLLLKKFVNIAISVRQKRDFLEYIAEEPSRGFLKMRIVILP